MLSNSSLIVFSFSAKVGWLLPYAECQKLTVADHVLPAGLLFFF